MVRIHETRTLPSGFGDLGFYRYGTLLYFSHKYGTLRYQYVTLTVMYGTGTVWSMDEYGLHTSGAWMIGRNIYIEEYLGRIVR
jgi:hypothetical protein